MEGGRGGIPPLCLQFPPDFEPMLQKNDIVVALLKRDGSKVMQIGILPKLLLVAIMYVTTRRFCSCCSSGTTRQSHLQCAYI